MAFRLNTAAQNLMADAVGDDLNAGTLTLYTGTQPASANDAATGTVLAAITLPADAFAAAVGGVISLAGTWQDPAANADGTAGWFRFAGGSVVLDGNVTGNGGGGDMELSNTGLVINGVVDITSCALTMPAE